MRTKMINAILINAGMPIAVFFGLVFFLGVPCAAITAVIALLLVRTFFSFFSDVKYPLPLAQSRGESRKTDYIRILAYVLIVRLLVYLFAFVIARIGGSQANIADSFYRIWQNNGTDANHYIGIARSWYVTEGDPMYRIVFLPAFPLLVKLFGLLFSDLLLSATVLNLILSFGIGIAAYELCLCDYDRKTALRFVRYVFIIPAAFFYAAPMSESAFVLLSLLCLLFAKKKRFVLCAVFGILASFTRLQGVILMLPCGYMALRDFIVNKKTKAGIIRFALRLVCVTSFSLGMLAYLYINYRVWGNPLKFTVFQWHHWNQRLGFFGNTVNTIWDELAKSLRRCAAVRFDDANFRIFASLWLPQIIFIFAAPIIVLCKTGMTKKIAKPAENAETDDIIIAETSENTETDDIIIADTADNTENCKNEQDATDNAFAEEIDKPCMLDTAYALYFLAYFCISVGATWLLSAPRYLMACIPLPLALSLLGRRKTTDIILTIVCILLGGLYFYMFARGAYIY